MKTKVWSATRPELRRGVGWPNRFLVVYGAWLLTAAWRAVAGASVALASS